MKKLSGHNIQQILGKLIIVCFLLLATIIFLNGIFNWNAGVTAYNNMSRWLRGTLFLLAAVGTVFFFGGTLHFFCCYSNRFSYRTIITAVWILLVVLQLIFLCNAGNLLRYDALKIYDEAVSIFYDGEISPTTKEGYFSYYANNHPIVIITFLILKVGRLLHIVAADFGNGIFFLQLINLMAIDVALFFGYLFIRDVLKKKTVGFVYMIVALVSPLSYIWIPFYYTNTLCMPFFMAGLWLAFRFGKMQKHGDRKRKNMVLLWAAGVFLGIGFMIRATVIITIIALFLAHLFMPGICEPRDVNRKEFAKKCFLQLIIFAMGLLLGAYSLRPFTNKYVRFDYTHTAFPTVHWLMMGADGEGTFNKKDEAFTAYFTTAEDKRNADKIVLKERLQEMGAGGTIVHAIGKMCLTFSDGTGNYEQELSISDRYGSFYRYVYGDCNEGVKTCLQILYMTVFLCAILTAVRLLKEKNISHEFVIILNLLGAFLFYMLWEAGSIYNMGFMPLYYIILACGVSCPIFKKRVTVSVLAVTFLILVYFGQNKSDNELVYQVNQYMFQTDNYCECTDGMLLEQTFESEGSFDHISVQVRNPLAMENDSIYELTLLEENGTVLDSCRIKAAAVADYAFVTFSLATVHNEGSYKLIIQKKSGIDNMIWLYYDTGNYDAYKKGELVGLPVQSTMDLAFKVYSGSEKEDYFQWYSNEKQKNVE